ncbi:hypothetical protein F4781DRAFT_383951 [Annulohypoxylon bovei var. microspora]|nr:hypothetical protein F4781DRAFT_383951 [Annulohypoxylon bovei var. microspora]
MTAAAKAKSSKELIRKFLLLLWVTWPLRRRKVRAGRMKRGIGVENLTGNWEGRNYRCRCFISFLPEAGMASLIFYTCGTSCEGFPCDRSPRDAKAKWGDPLSLTPFNIISV